MFLNAHRHNGCGYALFALLLFVLNLTSIEVRLDGNFRGEKAM